ncbi:predicted protein [Aspergillus terreus NIH2624]|uniref:Uncharacterized protein n=1 Tax=Aspergillus terreus (strain NIH 2624 / FGSC A1156) TaxID=341663 RepID=Q0C8Z2_ASPTN|nr:uncharacterized protein ATEG_09842 [Aspergillus terreus NIH2624]EAU30033.1 predicted protein [Aspergillus terreus NIH2624]
MPIPDSRVLPVPYAISLMAGLRHWKPLSIPGDLKPAGKQTARPVTFQVKILILIIEMLDMASQIAFALTCKQFLKVALMAKLKLSEMEGVQIYYGNLADRYILLTRVLPRCPRTLQFSREWNVCHSCAYIRPTRELYWLLKKPSIVSLEEWSRFVYDWKYKRIIKCPSCQARGFHGPLIACYTPSGADPTTFTDARIVEVTDDEWEGYSEGFASQEGVDSNGAVRDDHAEAENDG